MKLHFPKTTEEVKLWKPTVKYRSLDRRIIVVATTRIEGSWSAYIGAVDGLCHDKEYFEVLKNGAKLDENIARSIFFEFTDIPYSR